MLGFTGLPTGENLRDDDVKKYLERFGELKYCRIRRIFHGRKGGRSTFNTGVADVLFQNIQGQTYALSADHVYKDRPCTLTREAFLKEKERLKERFAKGNPLDAVVMVGHFWFLETTKNDIEKFMAAFKGFKEVYLTLKGKAFVLFDTPFNAVHFVQKGVIVPGQKEKVPQKPKFLKVSGKGVQRRWGRK